MEMSVVEGRGMTMKANEKKLDEHMEKLYVSLYPHIQNENFMTFTQFKDRVTGKNKPSSNNHNVVRSGKSDEEIIQDATNILSMSLVQVDFEKVPKDRR
ncbi:hypothetical protein SD78_1438 [Bacillus badius]|nr:hypothetical protein SD78_1438 [Bacillus badius]